MRRGSEFHNPASLTPQKKELIVNLKAVTREKFLRLHGIKLRSLNT
jgi:hypothetical protein